MLVCLAALTGSCVYYNTFYLARKYYFKGTGGLPYTVEKTDPTLASNFPKSIDLSKKVLANYPKSKLVADAYLLWARALLGRDDPRQTVNMLQDFDVRFPNSKLRWEALFYLGVGYGRSHRYSEAETAFEQFLAQSPRHDLAPYAWLERSRALTALDRDSAAAYCAGQVLERFPKSKLRLQALTAHADASLQAGDYARARTDYQELGTTARNDDERLTFLLDEADCLEAAREFKTEMDMLKDALGHEQAPIPASGSSSSYQPSPGGDRYGRILMRIGGVHALDGRLPEALDAYREVIRLYPKSSLSAEAQYRIGYAYETAGDDLAHARAEYARVKDEAPTSAFATQAQSRITNLDRIQQFRTATGDTIQRQAEIGLGLGEMYLFQLNKPDRALEEYTKLATQVAGSPWAGKALNAEGWVLSRKLGRRASADSVWWIVVRKYAATESQLAARDYLEQDGITVPDSLIQLPKEPETPPPALTAQLTQVPAGTTPLGAGPAADTLLGSRPGGRLHTLLAPPRVTWDPRYAGLSSGAPSVAGESPEAGGPGAAAPKPAPRPPSPAPPPRPGSASPDSALRSGAGTGGPQPRLAAPDSGAASGQRQARPDSARLAR